MQKTLKNKNYQKKIQQKKVQNYFRVGVYDFYSKKFYQKKSIKFLLIVLPIFFYY